MQKSNQNEMIAKLTSKVKEIWGDKCIISFLRNIKRGLEKLIKGTFEKMQELIARDFLFCQL